MMGTNMFLGIDWERVGDYTWDVANFVTLGGLNVAAEALGYETTTTLYNKYAEKEVKAERWRKIFDLYEKATPKITKKRESLQAQLEALDASNQNEKKQEVQKKLDFMDHVEYELFKKQISSIRLELDSLSTKFDYNAEHTELSPLDRYSPVRLISHGLSLATDGYIPSALSRK